MQNLALQSALRTKIRRTQPSSISTTWGTDFTFTLTPCAAACGYGTPTWDFRYTTIKEFTELALGIRQVQYKTTRAANYARTNGEDNFSHKDNLDRDYRHCRILNSISIVCVLLRIKLFKSGLAFNQKHSNSQEVSCMSKAKVGVSMLYCLGEPFNRMVKRLGTMDTKYIEILDDGTHDLDKKRIALSKKPQNLTA